ncbi:MAG: hypothetical protein HUK04_00475 [Bacteroidaceae bacterium]|nr:hypothetical protein [Bacteroidaceae bacterium]
MTDTLPQLIAWLTGFVGLGLFQWLNTRKANKRLAEAQADLAEAQSESAEAQADIEKWHFYKEQLDIANGRIVELLTINKDKETRFIEQTQRLRDTQQRELDANERAIQTSIKFAEANVRIADVERENGELKVRLANHECIKMNCIHRDPPNEHTKKAIEKEKRKQNKVDSK